MLGDSRKVVNPFEWGEKGLLFEACLNVAEMRRLPAIAAGGEQRCCARIQFGKDGELVTAVGQVCAVLTVLCQRCLEPLRLDLRPAVHWGIVTSEAAAERLQAGLEPVMVTGQRANLAEWVEDELILAMPVVPMHQPAECAVTLTTPAVHDVDHPFAVLESLVKNKGTSE